MLIVLVLKGIDEKENEEIEVGTAYHQENDTWSFFSEKFHFTISDLRQAMDLRLALTVS